MQPGDPTLLTDDDLTASSLLTLLLDHYPALLSVDEMVRESAGLTGDRRKVELVVADGLSALLSSGLAHKIDGFVFASRSAVRAAQLRF